MAFPARENFLYYSICCHDIFLICCRNRQYFPLCCQLPESICCRLPNDSFLANRLIKVIFLLQVAAEIFLIVACCDKKSHNCRSAPPLRLPLDTGKELFSFGLVHVETIERLGIFQYFIRIYKSEQRSDYS